MNKKIKMIIALLLTVNLVFALGKNSSGGAPAQVSNATVKAEKKAAAAQSAAASSKQHSEQAKANLNSAKAEYEVTKARADAAKAESAAKNAAKQAQILNNKALKDGSPEARAAAEYVEALAREAEIAAREAERLASEAEQYLADYKSKGYTYEEALADLAEKNRLSEEALAYLKAAEQADAEYTEAWNNYKQYKKEMDALIDRMESDREKKSKEEYDALINDYLEKEKKVQAEYKAAEIAAEKTIDAYNKLGEFYKETGYSGDPVFVGTGEYTVSYTDYTAQDYLEKFHITRNLVTAGYEESFGTNWTCSLDTRIVRCNFKDWSEKKGIIENCIEITNSMKKLFDDYDARNPMFPREESKEYKSYSENMYNFLQKDLADVKEIIATRDFLCEKNKFCTYGRFKNPESYYGYSKQLIFLDEDGNQHYFRNEGNGVWLSEGVINKENIKIYDFNDGYKVCFADGNINYYDKYGILYKKVDRNGNETLFYNQNGRISEIVLKTGEHIKIARNANGYITSVYGNCSGTASYNYSGNELISVTDNNKVNLRFSYWEKLLSEICKADDKKISIKYEYVSDWGKYLCSQVINENGKSEYFSYDKNSNSVKHITYDGRQEFYKLGNDKNPVYIKDNFQNETKFELNEQGLIIAVENNGIRKSFAYDQWYRPIRVNYNNGGTTSIEYVENSCSPLISKIVDADGFVKKYIYDAKGNLIQELLNDHLCNEYEYYNSGLVKKCFGDVNESYDYNNFGSKVYVERNAIDDKKLFYRIEYDEKNRIKKYSDENGRTIEFTYSDFSTEEISNRYRKKYFYDKRKRVSKIEQTDFITNKTITKEYSYDVYGNLVKVILNGRDYLEKNYSEDGELYSQTVWNYCDFNDQLNGQGIKNTFAYNENGFLISENCSPEILKNSKTKSVYTNQTFETELKYNKSGSTREVTVTNDLGLVSVNSYDMYGRVVNEVFPNGYERKTTYSKAGRVIYKTDSDFKKWEYKYNSDGSWNVFVYLKNNEIGRCSYDKYGRLISYEDKLVGKNSLLYKNNLLIEENTPFYTQEYNYDSYGRKISQVIRNNDVHNFRKSVNSDGKLKEKHYKYDDVNLTVLEYITNPEEFFCELFFDGFGNIVKTYDKAGINVYEYDPLGRVQSKTDGDGNVTYYGYDANNLTCYVKFPNGAERFENHIVNGISTEITENNHVLRNVNYDVKNRTVTFTDCFGNDSVFAYEKNGAISQIEILKSGTLKSTDKTLVAYEVPAESKGIVRDSLGRIQNLTNQYIDTEFSYDLYGNLLAQKDLISGCYVEYEYDQFCRLIAKNVNGNKDFYQYDNCGRVRKIENNTASVEFEYDSVGRLISKEYWNGVVEKVSYNDYGLVECKITKDRLGQIIGSEVLLYDQNGRLEYVFDKSGDYTHYTYNEKGQLKTVEYPYSNNFLDYYTKESIDIGCPVLLSPTDEKLYLKSDVLSQVEKILAKNELINFVQISTIEPVWKEEFLYTINGSVSSVINNIGTTVYEYDDYGRLDNKYIAGFPDNKMKLSWNEKGCLTEVDGVITKLNLSYGNNNRISHMRFIDTQTNSSVNVAYFYDPLGRRICESYESEDDKLLIYEGFSTYVLADIPVYKNGLYNDSIDLDNSYYNSGIYRYMTSEDYLPYGTERSAELNSPNIDKGSSSSTVYYTYCKGEPVFEIENGTSKCFVKNYRNNILCNYDESNMNRMSFDVYGSDFTDEYNIASNIKNIGYRDYISLLKTFTSVDMAHDGTNWYAYCSGDPVNYIDNNGKNIIPIPEVYLMTDQVYAGICTGNSTDSLDGINYVGCYVTSFANTVCELYKRGVTDADKIQYTSVFGVNNNKEIFSSEPGQGASLDRNKSMNEIFNSSNDYADVSWDYFTAECSGEMRIKIELAKANALQDDYAVMGVFDLSEKYSKVPNHMVVINETYNEDGIFENITASSANDKIRQKENPDVYCVDNLKEIRLVKVENKNCSK